MQGLSTTAIGHRPLGECIDIYRHLESELKLEYLELAVGTCNSLDIIPDMKLVLHDRCLFSNKRRIPFSLLRHSTWQKYKQVIEGKEVVLLSIHPPERKMCSWYDVVRARAELEDYMQVPVALEVMPAPHYWCYKEDSLLDIPLCLDISHVNIWCRGNVDKVKQVIEVLHNNILEVHLSDNNGYVDSHNLIPNDAWFMDVEWAAPFVTYEALPARYYKYERMDKQNARSKQ